MTSLEYRQDVWHQKASVTSLPCRVVCVMIICLAALIQVRLVTYGWTDRRTDGHRVVAHTVLALRRAGKYMQVIKQLRKNNFVFTRSMSFMIKITTSTFMR